MVVIWLICCTLVAVTVRSNMNKSTREKVLNKYDCKCAYCGNPLDLKSMQVDHIQPIYRNDSDENLERMKVIRGDDSIENYNPACRRCNHWKSTFTVEKFRGRIEAQLFQLKRDNSNYRMALDFGLIKEKKEPVIFHFELCD